jgi:hypothetical protein
MDLTFGHHTPAVSVIGVRASCAWPSRENSRLIRPQVDFETLHAGCDSEKETMVNFTPHRLRGQSSVWAFFHFLPDVGLINGHLTNVVEGCENENGIICANHWYCNVKLCADAW